MTEWDLAYMRRSVQLQPASAVQDPLTDRRKPCTCDGAGRGPGRKCVVKAGGRLGELWRCAHGSSTTGGSK